MHGAYAAFGLGLDLPRNALPHDVTASLTGSAGYYWFGSQSASLGGLPTDCSEIIHAVLNDWGLLRLEGKAPHDATRSLLPTTLKVGFQSVKPIGPALPEARAYSGTTALLLLSEKSGGTARTIEACLDRLAMMGADHQLKLIAGRLSRLTQCAERRSRHDQLTNATALTE